MHKIDFKANQATEALRKTAAQLEDMTPIYQDVLEYMIEATRKRFATGTAPDGTKWAPKKQSTLDRYKRLGYGNLNRLLIGPGRRLSREIVGQANAHGVLIGSSLIYSGVMQDGAAKGAFGNDRRGKPIPWGNIPARVWLGMSAADELAVIEITEEHLERNLDASD